MNKSSASVYKTVITPEESVAARSAYAIEMARQGADKETIKMLMGPQRFREAVYPLDVPVYNELKKIPLLEQLKLLQQQDIINTNEIKRNPELALPPSEEERRQEYLKKLRDEDIYKNQRYA